MRSTALFVLLSLAAPAWARSGQLWSERNGEPALATVPDFKALAATMIPAVVSISVEQSVRVSSGRGRAPGGAPGGPGAPNDPFFDYLNRFFGGEIPHEYHNRGIGTGFIIGKDGLILTNYHVVEGADRIEVTFYGKGGVAKTMTAEVLGKAPQYDVALIKTHDNADAPIAYLGNSDEMEIGDWVMAVGNPFGLSHSVSVGIISAKERRDIAPSGRAGTYDFIQTDASINPGNSGGPLVNLKGEVIGINTAINAQGSGIGFAIPINMVKSMLPELKEKGRYARSWIGIKIQPLTGDLAQSYGLAKSLGALVSEVVANSPAEQAGLREGDVILTFDGKVVRDNSDLPLFASMAGVGKKVEVKIWREGKESTRTVTLQEFPDEEVQLASKDSGEPAGELGITIADITPDLQREFRLDTPRGAVIKDVEPGSLGARSGLRPGDVVLSLNGNDVTTAREFASGVKAIKSGGLLRLKVLRQNGKFFLAIRKP
jgi:serine protease Do